MSESGSDGGVFVYADRITLTGGHDPGEEAKREIAFLRPTPFNVEHQIRLPDIDVHIRSMSFCSSAPTASA
jgi:hypothetical protein